MLLFYINILFIIIVKSKGEFVDVSKQVHSLICKNINNQLDKFENFKKMFLINL